jgi:glycosyltransferase involved in cell wall biosynthesis
LDQYLHQAAGRQLHVIPTKRNATLAISSLLLGEATLRALSASTPQYLPHYKQTVRDFLGDITGRAYIPDPDLLVVGSAVLSAMGRRDSTSLSVIARRPEKLREGISPRVQCVNALFTPEEVQDLLEDARFHVHFDSLRFLSLDRHAGWPVERLQALGLNAADVAELQPLGHYLSLPKPPARHMRVFGLVVLRNDAKTVEMYLKALAPYVDGVLIIDDSSTDGTLAIVRQVAATCKVKMIIQHQSSELIGSPWKAAMLRNVLLRRGRALGGTHFVHLHSDQVLTMNTLSHGNWKRRLEDLGPGDSLCYSAITLWKARHYLRLDWLEHYYGGVKSDAENQRCVAFADEAGTVFTEEFPALNNIPTSLRGRKRHFPTAIDGILELHALAYRNYNLKWFWYKVMERLMYPDRPSEEINQRYYTRLLWAGQRTRQASVDLWYYDFMDMDKLEVLVTEWREAQVLKIFEERGRATFSDLGVLDLDWGFGLGVAPSEFEIVPPSCLKPGRVALTIVYTTKRPGGYDVVLNALGQQTSRDFELVCVDELAPYREHQIREMAAARGVTVTFIQKSKVPSEKRRYKIQNAYNSGLLMVRGQLVSILNDYAWLPSRFVEETIKFYSNSLHCKALLGYPEIWFRPPGEFTDDGKMMSSPVVQFDAIARNDSLSVFNPPLDRSPLEAGWERVPKSIMYPLDALPTHIKSHWFWDGGVYTGPLQMYLDLNGFDEDLDHGSDHQAENMSDRACFLGYKMYVAGIDLAHQQINNQFFGQAETWNRYGAVNNYVRWGAKWKAIKEGNWPVPTQNQYNLTQALLELGWTPHW